MGLPSALSYTQTPVGTLSWCSPSCSLLTFLPTTQADCTARLTHTNSSWLHSQADSHKFFIAHPFCNPCEPSSRIVSPLCYWSRLTGTVTVTGQLDAVVPTDSPFGSPFPFSLLNTLASALVCARFTFFVPQKLIMWLAKEVKGYTNTCLLSTSPCPALC